MSKKFTEEDINTKKFTEKDIDKMMEEVLEGAINPQAAPQMSLLQRYKAIMSKQVKPNGNTNNKLQKTS